MKRVELRGVVVYVNAQGEANKRIGIYTEEGMKFLTLYGAKSARKHIKSACALFTMGKFTLGLRNEQYSFVDVDIYDNGFMLSNDINIYYAACVGAEIVKKMIGAEHEPQFKCLVEYLLYLIQSPSNVSNTTWRAALIIFLSRSLLHNGWQPALPSRGDVVQYSESRGFVTLSHDEVTTFSEVVPYSIIELLLQSNLEKYTQAVSQMSSHEESSQITLLSMLFRIWHEILGHSLSLAKFVIH